MLNFHNVYDFFNDSQKSIQKRGKSAQLSASLSPLLILRQFSTFKILNLSFHIITFFHIFSLSKNAIFWLFCIYRYRSFIKTACNLILSYQESLIPKSTVNVNGSSVQVFLNSLPFGMYQFSVGSTNNFRKGYITEVSLSFPSYRNAILPAIPKSRVATAITKVSSSVSQKEKSLCFFCQHHF